MITPTFVNLNDWYEFGGGAAGASFYHKSDENLVLKLYPGKWEHRAYSEFERSRKVFELGVPCPETYEYVTDGNRFGLISQRINNKKSFFRVLSEQPERVDEMARRFADMALKLHKTECDTTVFRPMKERYEIAFSKMDVPEDVREDLFRLLHSFPDGTTCLHGDMQGGNIITDGENDYWIDLGDFGYGSPTIEFSTQWHNATNLSDDKIMDMFHIHKDLHMEFTRLVFQYYYNMDKLPEKEQQEIMLRIRRSAVVEFSRWMYILPEEKPDILPMVQQQLEELRIK